MHFNVEDDTKQQGNIIRKICHKEIPKMPKKITNCIQPMISPNKYFRMVRHFNNSSFGSRALNTEQTQSCYV